MIGLFLLVTSALAEPFVYDDGEIRCILYDTEPVGVHEQALAAWAPRGEAIDGEELLDCEDVKPKIVDCPEGLGSALPFAGPIDKYIAGEGVKVSRMSGNWLHVRGKGDLSVVMNETDPPVLLRLKQEVSERLANRPGTVFDLKFEADYIGGTGELVRIGTSVMVLSAGDVFIQEAGQPPVAYAVAPLNKDPQFILKPGKSRTVAMDEEVVDAVVGNPLVAGAVVRGHRVKVTGSAPGETRIGLVLAGGRIVPVRVIVR